MVVRFQLRHASSQSAHLTDPTQIEQTVPQRRTPVVATVNRARKAKQPVGDPILETRHASALNLEGIQAAAEGDDGADP